MSRTQISIRVLDEQLKAIDEIAERERRTRANVIEVLLAEALERRAPSTKRRRA